MTPEELSKLTPEQKRIKIAEAQGFVAESDPYYSDHKAWLKDSERFGTCDLPDYLNDLNAMHEVEMSLSVRQHYTFRALLWELTDQSQDRSWVGVNGEEHNRRYVSATAAQRADAFLLTVSL